MTTPATPCPRLDAAHQALVANPCIGSYHGAHAAVDAAHLLHAHGWYFGRKVSHSQLVTLVATERQMHQVRAT